MTRRVPGPPAYVHVITLAVILPFMSGSSHLYGLPLPPDRIALAVGIVLLIVHPDLRRAGVHLAGVHVLMAAVVAWCIGSMIWFATIEDPTARFALLDAMGVVPFALFLLAPLVYATRRRRHVLLRALTVLGLYLGYVAVAEGLQLYSLVFPRGIVDPSNPHFGRALGPTQQVGSNGLALLACIFPAALYAAHSRGWRRAAGALAALLCTAGVFFTLTRSMWLALVLGVLVVIIVEPRVRGRLIVGGAAAGILVGGYLALSPSVQDEVTARAQTSRSVYDRLNANDAAVRVVLARPLAGVGMNRFHKVEEDWVWQDPEYPITNMGIDVHNVLLGHAAELGLPGVTLWLSTLLYACWSAARGPRTRDGPLRDFRVLALFYLVAWSVVAMLVPIKYAFPTAMLWLTLGIVADHRRLGLTHLPAPHPDGGQGPGDHHPAPPQGGAGARARSFAVPSGPGRRHSRRQRGRPPVPTH